MTDKSKVKELLKKYNELDFAFGALPPKVRKELGDLMAMENDGEKAPGYVIKLAINEWLDGGRA